MIDLSAFVQHNNSCSISGAATKSHSICTVRSGETEDGLTVIKFTMKDGRSIIIGGVPVPEGRETMQKMSIRAMKIGDHPVINFPDGEAYCYNRLLAREIECSSTTFTVTADWY